MIILINGNKCTCFRSMQNTALILFHIPRATISTTTPSLRNMIDEIDKHRKMEALRVRREKERAERRAKRVPYEAKKKYGTYKQITGSYLRNSMVTGTKVSLLISEIH